MNKNTHRPDCNSETDFITMIRNIRECFKEKKEFYETILYTSHGALHIKHNVDWGITDLWRC